MIFGKSINKYYIRYLHLFLFGLIALLVVDYVQLLIPGLIGEVIDGLRLLTITMDEIKTIMTQIAMYALFIIFGRFLWRIFIFGASRRFDYHLRNDMFEHAEKLSSTFYSEHKVGGLMAYFTNDLEAVRRAAGPGMIMLVDSIFLGGLATYKMYQLNPTMTYLSAIPLFFIALIGSYLGRKMRKKFKEAQKAFEDLSDFTNENLSGISVIKAFVKEQIEIREFLKANKVAKDRNVEYVILQSILNVTIHTVISIIFIIIIGYGGFLVKSTATDVTPFSAGDLTEFFLYFGNLIWPMMALSMIINVRSRGRASLSRIEQILEEPIDVYDSKDVLPITALNGSIEFKHLTFQYPDGKTPVLEDISFTVEKGETIGILGRTGSGKTSIVDLLLRIYNVDEGSLFIDGYDIMKLPIHTVRNAIGYVPQDGFLFSDSIANNISLSYNNQHEIDEQIKSAARLSDVHDNIVEFSDGYETIIGERGVTLSGGQRQRVSIARALIKDPAIMILDDSVSAVDTKTEETILGNLKAVRNGKTTIIIAHRISTIKNADKIIVVEDGRVIDVGKHNDLIKRCEFYKDIVQRQQLEDEIEVK